MNENLTRKTYGPRAIVSFRPAEPVSQMIKLEAGHRKSTATEVIARAVAISLGHKYPSQLLAWKRIVDEERAERLALTKKKAAARLKKRALKNLSKVGGVDARQIPATSYRLAVEHAAFDAPGGDNTSMPKSPALPVAAQPGTI